MKLYCVEYGGIEGDQFDGAFYGASADEDAGDPDYWGLEHILEPGDVARLWECTLPDTCDVSPFLLHGTAEQVYRDGYEAMTALRSVRGFVASLVLEWYPGGEDDEDGDEDDND